MYSKGAWRRKTSRASTLETFSEIRDLLQPGEGEKIYGAGSCDTCLGEGFSGRVGVFELMSFNRSIRDVIVGGGTARELQEAAVQNGMIEFRRGALLKVAHGETSVEEVLRDLPGEQLGLED